MHMEKFNNDPDKKNEEKISQAYEAFNRGEIKKTRLSPQQTPSSNNPEKKSDSTISNELNNIFDPFEKYKKEDISGTFKTELKDLFKDDRKA